MKILTRRPCIYFDWCNSMHTQHLESTRT